MDPFESMFPHYCPNGSLVKKIVAKWFCCTFHRVGYVVEYLRLKSLWNFDMDLLEVPHNCTSYVQNGLRVTYIWYLDVFNMFSHHLLSSYLSRFFYSLIVSTSSSTFTSSTGLILESSFAHIYVQLKNR